MRKIPYLFRGKPHPSEHYYTGVRDQSKYIYGGYYRDDRYEYIITNDAQWRATNISILVGYDCDGKPAFSDDVLVDDLENEYTVRRDMSPKKIARLKLLKRP